MDNCVENLADAHFLKDNLTFTSLFITVYESMTDYVVSNVHDLLCYWKIEKGKEIYTETADYKEKIKNRIVDEKGNKDRTKASFLWLVDCSAITHGDYESFLFAKKIRNKYAHELFNVIMSGVAIEDINCFGKMISLYRKITKWWFVEIEAGIIGDEIPDGTDIQGTQMVTNVLLDMIVDVLYNETSGKYKEILSAIQNGERQ